MTDEPNSLVCGDWHSCYDGGWQGIITCESFAHPAKFANGLIDRIYTHGVAAGWFKPPALIGDPFGGVGLGGIIGAYGGFHWVGVELEERFVGMAQRNFDLHRRKWERLGAPMPQIIRGDSREFAWLVGECDCVVTSPPFGVDQPCASQTKAKKDYHAFTRGDGTKRDHQMQTPGNIGNLREGRLDGVVTSPPWESSVNDASVWNKSLDPQKNRWPQKRSAEYTQRNAPLYGQADGQLGNTSGDTYWRAMAQVYAQCRLALKPSGVMVVVCKDYVKNKARVPLCDQTCELLTSLGYDVFQRIRAWLVKEETHPGLFGDVTTKTERKSFFRRLAEAKGSPRIDWEEVIVSRTPPAR